MKDRIIVKIGSQILTRRDGTLDVTRMSALVDQIAELHKGNIEVILVSSGAVASGKTEIKAKAKLDTVSSRQLYSSVGQVKLINRYSDLFHQHGIVCGQILVTKEDFATRRHYLNQRNCMGVMLDNKVIPIVNENDAISVNELMFTDNDELSGLVAAMMGGKKLIILSNIDGIFSDDPKKPDAKLFRTIDIHKDNIENSIQSSKSATGRGGMTTKYNVARKAAEEGIEVIIANGRRENILIDLVKGKEEASTRFIPSTKGTTSVKKWIAHSEGFTKGEIHVNQCAREVLLSDKAVSLLPVGVTSITGNFEADDIVRIIDEAGKQIGIGKTAYSSEKAKEIIGKNNKKAIIHYDYLYIEK
ncbi:glutamate 5-kinase [Dysgonomonas sp. PFB1-18]|uniref:glutamate 5-kinase n=1 Tax=unclassified Dysgonomonas TaxID=2630389 RepID=UPI0024771548|nr:MULTISPECIES: glutamate 5-kinase [unclassified Dysgonomonas]MDH6307584.1 glutamate 5-kinase [Dysgonomonas sp. PF1-14]MDH6337502.1 glutamate 5-kinase [Dysgonomonas sp. PF1-16]MDH6378727.1 glutamate 5-kinase [Dysgonomonas sp. PFB1-18]MDH6399145.1 glutamate 5-kinase [Dysgonomonas sp. PF1-23]